jgi:hypothetical protein
MKAKYYIYRNLNKGGFSIKHKGKVIHHADTIIAIDSEFRVSEKGRQRCLRTKVRNVHAFVVCDQFRILKNQFKTTEGAEEVTYNPYKSPNFMCKGNPIKNAFYVVCQDNRCYTVFIKTI